MKRKVIDMINDLADEIEERFERLDDEDGESIEYAIEQLRELAIELGDG